MQEQTYDTNLEATLLSSIIYTPALLEKYSTKLNKNLFFLPLHQKIINIIQTLYKSDKLIDEEIVRNKLGKEYEDDLLYIIIKTPINRLDDYIEILQDYAIKREMQSIAFDISKSLQENISGLELQAKFSNRTEALKANRDI